MTDLPGLFKISSAYKPTAEIETFLGEPGNLFYSVDKRALVLSDGVTPGGILLNTLKVQDYTDSNYTNTRFTGTLAFDTNNFSLELQENGTIKITVIGIDDTGIGSGSNINIIGKVTDTTRLPETLIYTYGTAAYGTILVLLEALLDTQAAPVILAHKATLVTQVVRAISVILAVRVTLDTLAVKVKLDTRVVRATLDTRVVGATSDTLAVKVISDTRVVRATLALLDHKAILDTLAVRAILDILDHKAILALLAHRAILDIPAVRVILDTLAHRAILDTQAHRAI
jgi:hypothetical protein